MKARTNQTETALTEAVVEPRVTKSEPARPEAVEPPKILATLVVEEISIDGMCGIY